MTSIKFGIGILQATAQQIYFKSLQTTAQQIYFKSLQATAQSNIFNYPRICLSDTYSSNKSIHLCKRIHGNCHCMSDHKISQKDSLTWTVNRKIHWLEQWTERFTDLNSEQFITSFTEGGLSSKACDHLFQPSELSCLLQTRLFMHSALLVRVDSVSGAKT